VLIRIVPWKWYSFFKFQMWYLNIKVLNIKYYNKIFFLNHNLWAPRRLGIVTRSTITTCLWSCLIKVDLYINYLKIIIGIDIGRRPALVWYSSNTRQGCTRVKKCVIVLSDYHNYKVRVFVWRIYQTQPLIIINYNYGPVKA